MVDDVKKKTDAYLKELDTLAKKNQQKLDQRGQKFANRIESDTEKDFANLTKKVVASFSGLSSDKAGIVKNTASNSRFVLAQRKQWQDIVNKIIKKGNSWFSDEGVKMQELTQKDFDSYKALAAKFGLDISFTLIDEEAFKQAAKQSAILYGDTFGDLAETVQAGIMRRILGGVTVEQLVEEYTNIVPAIDKPKKGGGRFKLSAEARSRFTFRTEIIRLASQINHELNKDAFGTDYHIQNLNPLDERTAPVCVAATQAGVMKVSEFVRSHGLSPRHVNCRCTQVGIPAKIAVRI